MNRQIFTGQEHDENTGLIYFGARYYDPDTARFITQDAYLGEAGVPPSLHRYLYAYSNPTVYVDPDGNVTIDPATGAQISSQVEGMLADKILKEEAAKQAARTFESQAAKQLAARAGLEVGKRYGIGTLLSWIGRVSALPVTAFTTAFFWEGDKSNPCEYGELCGRIDAKITQEPDTVPYDLPGMDSPPKNAPGPGENTVAVPIMEPNPDEIVPYVTPGSGNSKYPLIAPGKEGSPNTYELNPYDDAVNSGGYTGRKVGASKSTSKIVNTTQKQLQKKFKHASDFGVTGNYSKANAKKFNSAVNQHLNAPGTKPIQGTYRGDSVTHHLDPNTGLNVITDQSGNFVSGWRLDPEQLQNVLQHGGLN